MDIKCINKRKKTTLWLRRSQPHKKDHESQRNPVRRYLTSLVPAPWQFRLKALFLKRKAMSVKDSGFI
jgi:hypothetical protein